MRTLLTLAAVCAVLSPVAAVASPPSAVQNAASSFDTPPMTRVAAADYVKLSADAINYRIEASRLAIRKAQRDDVRVFARADLAAAEGDRAALLAALNNDDRRIARPSTELSSEREAAIALLRQAPRDAFDDLYLTQLSASASSAWALQQGYSVDGSDPALRQIATVSAPKIEASHAAALALTPSGLTPAGR